jgi:hypothetical protein
MMGHRLNNMRQHSQCLTICLSKHRCNCATQQCRRLVISKLKRYTSIEIIKSKLMMQLIHTKPHLMPSLQQRTPGQTPAKQPLSSPELVQDLQNSQSIDGLSNCTCQRNLNRKSLVQQMSKNPSNTTMIPTSAVGVAFSIYGDKLIPTTDWYDIRRRVVAALAQEYFVSPVKPPANNNKPDDNDAAAK